MDFFPNLSRLEVMPMAKRNLLVGAVVVAVLMFTAPHFMATTSGAYKLAVATAHQSPQFREALGTPVTEAWFSEGTIKLGNSADAKLLIPVRGPKQNGSLRVQAAKDDGGWRLRELTLELERPAYSSIFCRNSGR
jgi:hypothetical protein